jgi:hypothetical protein
MCYEQNSNCLIALNERRSLPTIEEQHRKSPTKCSVDRAKTTVSLPSALQWKRCGLRSCLQADAAFPPFRATLAWGVNHATVSPFPSMAYKSAYVKPLSALRSSSVDTSRFNSCKGSGWRRLTSSRRPWLSTMSCNRLH